jgi:hypothetical protein
LAFLPASSFLATACRSLPPPIGQGVTTAVGLDEFIALSRILTGVADLDDQESARLYLSALTTSPEKNERLAELCERARSLDATDTSPLHETPRLAEIADVILGNWYSGVYVDADGQPRVATYVGALGWQALGYRPLGPTTCGGAFGHWATAPTA